LLLSRLDETGLPWTTLRGDHGASLRPQAPPSATPDRLVHSWRLFRPSPGENSLGRVGQDSIGADEQAMMALPRK
jgi:hypothetical protein